MVENSKNWTKNKHYETFGMGCMLEMSLRLLKSRMAGGAERIFRSCRGHSFVLRRVWVYSLKLEQL